MVYGLWFMIYVCLWFMYVYVVLCMFMYVYVCLYFWFWIRLLHIVFTQFEFSVISCDFEFETAFLFKIFACLFDLLFVKTLLWFMVFCLLFFCFFVFIVYCVHIKVYDCMLYLNNLHK